MAAAPITALLTPEGQLGHNPQSSMLLNMFKGALTGTTANALSDADKDGILDKMAEMLGGDRSYQGFSTGRKRPAMATGELILILYIVPVCQNQSYTYNDYHLHTVDIYQLS